MLDALKTLFENNVISEEVKGDIEQAWEKKLQEHREYATQELREEFAAKYEHDKQAMIEAIDQMIGESLAHEVAEFAHDRKQLAEAKAEYAFAIREHSEVLQQFVLESLAKELQELHEDQKVLAENFSKLEQFVVESLAEEIAEFYQDKQDLADTKVALVKEAKEQFEHVKATFVKKAAKLVENTVATSLTHEIHQLKEDIDQARSNDFGRKIFEAFTAEYQHSLLNERSETSKLLKVIAQKDRQLAESKEKLVEKERLAEQAHKQLAKAKELAERRKIMGELLSPLNTQQREIMHQLLESVQTSRLEQGFEKYLPAVLNESKKPKSTVLNESRVVTGNKNESIASQAEVTDIRRLAGLN